MDVASQIMHNVEALAVESFIHLHQHHVVIMICFARVLLEHNLREFEQNSKPSKVGIEFSLSQCI